MKFEIKNTRHGDPEARLTYTSNNAEEIFVIVPGLVSVSGILKLVAYLVEYLKGIL
jgi:hypothetical protein